MKMKDILANAEVEKVDSYKTTTNLNGHEAYELPDKFKLLSLLNTTKLEPEYYRKQSETVEVIKNLIDTVAKEDPLFVAKAIVYSRCMRDGMRSVNSLAAALLADHISGLPWAKDFYSSWNRTENYGGCVFRIDDMLNIKDAYNHTHLSTLSNAMRKAFKNNLETASAYSLLKYKKATIDITNLVHPRVSKSATIEHNGEYKPVIDLIINGETILANTWETMNSTAGIEVSEKVKAGELTQEEALKEVREAKAKNWEKLIMNGELGVLAMLRNLRNIVDTVDNPEVIDKVVNTIRNHKVLKEAKIMPYQVDFAYETILTYTQHNPKRRVKCKQLLMALTDAIEGTVGELSEILTGKNLVILDCSGSMSENIKVSGNSLTSSCLEKASLIAAMIEKASNADVIVFGDNAKYVKKPNECNLFQRAKELREYNLGCTNLASAINIARNNWKNYKRVFILSDNECNCGYQVNAYKDLIKEVGSPYVYSIDLASYGTTPLKNDGKVRYYYGYGYSLFEDITKYEFNPEDHYAEVEKVRFTKE